jgi:hypothetical protein
VRFIVFEENTEETEVATDSTFLRKLCESSGGRLLEPAELPKFLAQLNDAAVDAQATTLLVPVWDQAWILWLIAGLFAADWYVRRKLGFA